MYADGSGREYRYCAECKSEIQRRADQQYDEKPESKVKKRRRRTAWAQAHPEAVRAMRERTYAKPEVKENHRARQRQYARDNPAIVNSITRRHEHRKRAAEGDYTEGQWQARLDLFGHRCYLCGCDWDALSSKQKHVEHVIPLSRGGTDWPANLRPACGYCNSSKGAKGMKPWRRFLRSRFAPWSRMVDGHAVV